MFLQLTVVENDFVGFVTLLDKRRLQTVPVLLHIDVLEQWQTLVQISLFDDASGVILLHTLDHLLRIE